MDRQSERSTFSLKPGCGNPGAMMVWGLNQKNLDFIYSLRDCASRAVPEPCDIGLPVSVHNEKGQQFQIVLRQLAEPPIHEKRKFDKEWTRLEQEYRAAGMSDTQIAAMREYDWSWFCSQRTYLNRVQALPSEQCEDESEQSCLLRKFESLSCTWDTGDVDAQRFGWLSSLEDERL